MAERKDEISRLDRPTEKEVTQGAVGRKRKRKLKTRWAEREEEISRSSWPRGKK